MRKDGPDFTQFTETSERRAHVQKWLARHAAKLSAAGAGASVLTLPAMALAQSGPEFVLLRSIDGVSQVAKQADGSLQVQTANGQTINVNAQDVRILQNGEIAISQNAATVVAEAAGVGAGMAGMGAVAAVGGGLAAAGVVAAASEDGGSGGAPAATTLNLADATGGKLSSESTGYTAPDDTTSLTVTVDGTSYNATVAADGSWSVPLTPAQAAALAQGTQTVEISAKDAGGDEIGSSSARFDIDTQPPTVALDALPVGAVMNAAEQGQDLTVTGTTNAEDGQTVTVNVNGTDYTAEAQDGKFSVTVPQADLAALPDGSTVNVTADVGDAAGNPATQATASFDTDFAAPTISLDPVSGGSLDLGDAQGDLTITGKTSAEDGQTVTVTFDGTEYTTTAGGGAFSVTVPQAALQAIVDRPGDTASVEVSAAVSDAAGNAATPATVTVPGDFSSPTVTIGTVADDNIINAAEAGGDVTVSGETSNVLAGQTVTVGLNGKTYTGTTDGKGDWSVTIPAADAGALADGTATITADVSQDGVAAPQASMVIGIDTAAPTLSLDPLPVGAVMNAAEQSQDLIIKGSSDVIDREVSVTVNGKTYTEVPALGSFSVTVPAADLAALPDGATVTVTADIEDRAGNSAPQATASFDTDFTPPTLNFTDKPDPGEMVNSADVATDGTLEGTSDGTSVTVTITDSNGTEVFSGTSAVVGGAFSVPITAAQAGTLADNQTYTLTATATDANGNTTSEGGTFTTDFTAPTLAFDAPPSGGTIDLSEANAGDLYVTGTSDADGQTVTLNVAGKDYTAPVTGGTWGITVPSADVLALTDGASVPFAASVADPAGNTASATSNVQIDFSPVLTLDSVGANGAVDLADLQQNGLALSGDALGLADGTTVNVTLGGAAAGSTTSAGGKWSLTLPTGTFGAAKGEQDLDIAVNAAGANPASQSVVVFEEPPYYIQEVGRDGNDVTYGLFLTPDVDVSAGVAVTATVEFDPAAFTYDSATGLSGALFTPNEAGAAAGNVVFGLVALQAPDDLSQPVITFTGTQPDPAVPVGFEITTPDGGDSDAVFGTAGAETIAAADLNDLFTLVRPGGSDDSVDLGSAAPKLLIFEADPGANGTDTILNFTGGDDMPDIITFAGLTPGDLRGAGTGYQEVAATDAALGTDTGFVNYTVQLGGLSADDLATAAEGLQGEDAGDAFYILASDGTDSALAKITFAAPDDASAQIMAQFKGFSDLNGLESDSVIFPELSAAYT